MSRIQTHRRTRRTALLGSVAIASAIAISGPGLAQDCLGLARAGPGPGPGPRPGGHNL